MSTVLRAQKRLLLVGTAVTSLALVVGLFAFGFASSAQARDRTLFVGQTAGSNSGCASPGYTSVQAAVDAATNDDTVYLCGATNTYTEQVIITKSITLTGDKGATIKAPSPFPTTPLSRLPAQFTTDNLFIPQAVVIVWGANVHATISKLTVAGPLGNGSCANDEFGILVIAGASATINRDNVLNIADSNTALYGCQFGVGIQVGREYWPTANFSTFLVEDFVGHADINNTTVSGYQKNGMTIDGPGSSAEVEDSTVNGSGRDALFAPIIAQNGIQISRGASGEVSDSRVTGNSYTGTAPGASSTGILIFGGCGDPLVTNVEVEENRLINNDIGIALNNYTADCTAPAATPTQDKAIDNDIRNNAVTNASAETFNSTNYSGYQAGIDDVGNTDKIIDNDISGAGYAPQNTPNGLYVQPIDITSFPTINPIIRDNDINV